MGKIPILVNSVTAMRIDDAYMRFLLTYLQALKHDKYNFYCIKVQGNVC